MTTDDCPAIPPKGGGGGGGGGGETGRIRGGPRTIAGAKPKEDTNPRSIDRGMRVLFLGKRGHRGSSVRPQLGKLR